MRIYLGFDITKLVLNLLWIIPLLIGALYLYLYKRNEK